MWHVCIQLRAGGVRVKCMFVCEKFWSVLMSSGWLLFVRVPVDSVKVRSDMYCMYYVRNFHIAVVRN